MIQSPQPKSAPPEKKTERSAKRPAEPAFNPAWSRLAWGIQPKLAVSAPGDPAEQEADRIADTVMRSPEPQVLTIQQTVAGAGHQVARTPANGCTPQTTHQADPDGSVQRGFALATSGTEDAIQRIEVAQGRRPPLWWESRAEAANEINFYCCCPPPSELDVISARLRQMRTYLSAGFPYRCIASPAYCTPNFLGRRPPASSGRQGPSAPQEALICPVDLSNVSVVAMVLLKVAAGLAGLPHRGDPCDSSDAERYIYLSSARFPFAGFIVAMGPPSPCPPGRGVPPTPPEPPEPPGPEAPPPRDTSMPNATVYVDNPVRPTSWSFNMRSHPVPVDSRHDPTRPPNFIRQGGSSFDLCPGGAVRERTNPSSCPRLGP